MALHALVALGEPDNGQLLDALETVARGTDADAAPAAALALGRTGPGIDRLAALAGEGGETADVALYALGQLDARSVPISKLNNGARRIVEVMVRGETTWLRREHHRAELSLLQRQLLAVTLDQAADEAEEDSDLTEDARVAEAQVRLEAAPD